MTPLIAVVALLLAGALMVSATRRNRESRTIARKQQQALDTLGQLTSGRAAPTVHQHAAEPFQAHVRVVAADAEPPRLTPRPLTGGWRPTRATGAAPFRRPAPRAPAGPLSPEPAADAAPAELPADLDDLGGVRLVTGDAPAPSPAPAPALPAPVIPAAAATETFHFDDLGPATDAPAPPLPDTPTVAPAERAAWAARLAATPGATARLDEGADRYRPRHRRRSDGDRRRPGRTTRPERRAEERAASPAATAATPRRRSAPAGDRAAGGSARRWIAAGSVAAVLAVAGGVGAALATTQQHRERGTATAAAPPSTQPAPPPTAPPTTAPPPIAAKLVATSTGAATYQLNGPARIRLTATGPCWVEIRSGGDTGPVVYSQTMQAGATEAVSGAVWVRLGNPTAVTITVNGQQVNPPVTQGTPYDLTFQ